MEVRVDCYLKEKEKKKTCWIIYILPQVQLGCLKDETNYVELKLLSMKIDTMNPDLISKINHFFLY